MNRYGNVALALALVAFVAPGPPGEALAQAEPDTIDAPPVEIAAGSGRFVVPGGGEHPERRITVHYHRPEGFHRGSPVLMLVRGAGRNGDDYRDAWVEASEGHGVLVLSPSYPEKHGPEYWSYDLAGMTDRVKLELDFVVDTDPERWRLDEALHRLPSDLRDPHELFGHSAGGQILHRLARGTHFFRRARRKAGGSACPSAGSGSPCPASATTTGG